MDSLLDIGYAPTEDAAKQHGVALDELYVKWDINWYRELFLFVQLADKAGFDIPIEFGDVDQYPAFELWWDKHWHLFSYKEVMPNIPDLTGMSVEQAQQALANAALDNFEPVINHKFDLTYHNQSKKPKNDAVYKMIDHKGVRWDKSEHNYDHQSNLRGALPFWSAHSQKRSAFERIFLRKHYTILEEVMPQIAKFVLDKKHLPKNKLESEKAEILNKWESLWDTAFKKSEKNYKNKASNRIRAAIDMGLVANSKWFEHTKLKENEILEWFEFQGLHTKATRHMPVSKGGGVASRADKIYVGNDNAPIVKHRKKEESAKAKIPKRFFVLQKKFEGITQDQENAIRELDNEVKDRLNYQAKQCIQSFIDIASDNFTFPKTTSLKGPSAPVKNAVEKKAAKNLISKYQIRANILRSGTPHSLFANEIGKLSKKPRKKKLQNLFPFKVSTYSFRMSQQATVIVHFDNEFQQASNSQKEKILCDWMSEIVRLGFIDSQDTNIATSANFGVLSYTYLLLVLVAKKALQNNHIDYSKDMVIEVVRHGSAFEKIAELVNNINTNNAID